MRAHVELRVAIRLAVVAMLAWGFVELADAVLEHETHAVDRAILLALRDPHDPADPIGPRWMHQVGRDVTALGGFAILTLLSGAVLGYLVLRGARRIGWILVAGIAGAATWTQLLKQLFGRPRPELVPHMTEVYSASFPSGHSSMSAAAYLVLGLLVARVHRSPRVRAYVISVAVFIVVLVGVSRVYIGVHWPTDVLAGWALGAAWAIVVWMLAGTRPFVRDTDILARCDEPATA